MSWRRLSDPLHWYLALGRVFDILIADRQSRKASELKIKEARAATKTKNDQQRKARQDRSQSTLSRSPSLIMVH